MNAIQRDPQLQLYADVGIFTCIIFNVSRKPYDDVRVRQAIAYAIDRDAMVKTIFDGRGTSITGDVIPKSWWSHDAKADGTYTYNPDKAKELLKEAGYPNGLNITILAPITFTLHTRTAQVLQAQWPRSASTPNSTCRSGPSCCSATSRATTASRSAR